MNCKLINVLREDNNDNITELIRLCMYVDLLMEPKVDMTIALENGGKFWINHIKQDLKNKIVNLYQFDNICHRKFWDEGFYEKYLNQLYKEGWMKLSKK